MHNDNNERWWTVALSEEVPAGQPFAVTCDEREYVLFRDAEGAVRALIDQCAHRRAPLSLGHVTPEGWIECPYHGWRYDGASGGCRSIPNLSAQERVPTGYRVAAFAVAERAGFIYLWPHDGEPRQDPPQALPLESHAHAWHGSCLIAYPHAALADLLLDAPGAVLQTPRLTVIDAHRYGEPASEADGVVVKHAVAWTPKGVLPKGVTADYPLSLRVHVDAAGHLARVEIRADSGVAIASAQLAMTPVKPTLTMVYWRGSGADYRAQPIEIAARAQLSPAAIKAAFAYPSKLRRELVSKKIIAAA